MKILTVTNMWPISEHQYYGIFVKEQVEALKKYYPELENKIWFINGFKNRVNYLFSVFQINWHLIFNKYDVIHIHFGLSGLFLLFRLYKNAKVILTLHGSDINIEVSNHLQVWITKIVINHVDHIICVNDNMAKGINKTSHISVLPCAVNTDLFQPALKKDQQTIQIVFPGSIQRPVKNYQLFRSIIDIIKDTTKIEITEVIIDNMSRAEVSTALKESDILLLTSLSEGSPQIVKEAMCCNTPIVTSNVGDVAMLLKSVDNCSVINKFDEDLFADAVLKILNKNPKNRISNGRQRNFELGLDEKTTSQKIFDLYKSLSHKYE